MSSINFDNAYLLLIAIPLAILLIVPFVIAVRKENANWHNVASSVIHVLIAACFAFTAAGSSIETTLTETDVYVVADVSYSSQKNLTTIDNYIAQLKGNLPKNSKMGVVCFAKDAELYVQLGGRLKSVEGAMLDDSETDIENALDYTGTLFRDNVLKRVVLITDGKQTRVSDSGSLKRAVDTLKAADIYVDAIYVDNSLQDGAKEVQISSVDFTQNAFLNREETVTVLLQSSFDTQAKLQLYAGGELADEYSITLLKGTNTEEIKLPTAEKGEFDYEVRVEVAGDENKLNNNIKFTQRVSDKLSVLLIANTAEDKIALQNSYGAYADIAAYVASDASSAENIPVGIEKLCSFDEIVISDVDVTALPNYEKFLESVEKAVSLFGKTLLTYGDTNVHSKTEELKALNDMLPVRFGNADADKKLYTILIDCSTSMAQAGYMALAKRAATQLVQYLNEGDVLNLVRFDGTAEALVSNMEVSDTLKAYDKDLGVYVNTRDYILSKIDSIENKHGTVFSYGLKEAYNLMKSDQEHPQKQVMFITDGLNLGGATDNQTIDEIVTDMAKMSIVTSVIGIGAALTTSAANERDYLVNIASKTDGKYYDVPTEAALEDVMFGDISGEILDTIINDGRKYAIKSVRSADASLKDVYLATEDCIQGFIYNRSKAGSKTVLATEYEGRNVPLFAYWNYGNGTVASFTSKASGDWVDTWSSSSRMKFFGNTLTANTPAEKTEVPFLTELREDNGYLAVEITPATMNSEVRAEITVTSYRDGAEATVTKDTMTFASSLYTYRFKADAVGKYGIQIDYIYAGGDKVTANYSYSLSYLPEYDSFAVYDPSVLVNMLGGEGTVSEDGYLKIENDESRIGKYVLDLTVPLLVACVVLFAADVAIRKLKWEDIRSLFGKGKK